MTRLVAVTLLLAGGALSLAGCAGPPQGKYVQGGPNDAPYNDVSNPFCGALGECQPLRTTPYDMRGNPGGF